MEVIFKNIISNITETEAVHFTLVYIYTCGELFMLLIKLCDSNQITTPILLQLINNKKQVGVIFKNIISSIN